MILLQPISITIGLAYAEKAQKVVSDLAAVRLAFERDPGSPSVLTLPSP